MGRERLEEEILASGPGFVQHPDSPPPRDAMGTDLCSAGNDVLVLFIFAVAKYLTETSSQGNCLLWFTVSQVEIHHGGEKLN